MTAPARKCRGTASAPGEGSRERAERAVSSRRSRALASLAALFVAAGCLEEPRTEPVPLVEHALWEEVAPEEDPFRGERASEASCAPGSYREEPPFFEIDTAGCPHATLSQPLLADLRPGEVWRLLAYHAPLLAEEPAEGHLAIAIEARVVFEYRVPIPAPQQMIRTFVDVEERVPAGTPLRFHVHNHGDNQWRLLEITTGPLDVYPPGARQ